MLLILAATILYIVNPGIFQVSESSENAIEDSNIRQLRQACESRKDRLCENKGVDYFIQQRFGQDSDAMKKWAEDAEVRTTAGTKTCKDLTENKFQEEVSPCSEANVQELKNCLFSLERFLCKPENRDKDWVRYIDGYHIDQSCSDYVEDIRGNIDKVQKDLDTSLCTSGQGSGGGQNGGGQTGTQGPVTSWDVSLVSPESKNGVVQEDGNLNIALDIENTGDETGSYTAAIPFDNPYAYTDQIRYFEFQSEEVKPGEEKVKITPDTLIPIPKLLEAHEWCEIDVNLYEGEGGINAGKQLVGSRTIDTASVVGADIPSCDYKMDRIIRYNGGGKELFVDYKYFKGQGWKYRCTPFPSSWGCSEKFVRLEHDSIDNSNLVYSTMAKNLKTKGLYTGIDLIVEVLNNERDLNGEDQSDDYVRLETAQGGWSRLNGGNVNPNSVKDVVVEK